MRPAYFTVTPQVDADGLAQAQAVAGAGSLTLNGALISGGKWDAAGSFGQQVTIASTGSDAGRTFTVSGLDVDGKSVSATLSGTGICTTYFKQVTAIGVDAACAGNISAGFAGTAASTTFVVNYKMENFKASLAAIVSGTINATVQHTFDNVFASTWTAAGGTWFNHDDTDLVNLTANQNSNYAYPPTATRIIVNSVTSPGSVQYVVIVPA